MAGLLLRYQSHSGECLICAGFPAIAPHSTGRAGQSTALLRSFQDDHAVLSVLHVTSSHSVVRSTSKYRLLVDCIKMNPDQDVNALPPQSLILYCCIYPPDLGGLFRNTQVQIMWYKMYWGYFFPGRGCCVSSSCFSKPSKSISPTNLFSVSGAPRVGVAISRFARTIPLLTRTRTSCSVAPAGMPTYISKPKRGDWHPEYVG